MIIQTLNSFLIRNNCVPILKVFNHRNKSYLILQYIGNPTFFDNNLYFKLKGSEAKSKIQVNGLEKQQKQAFRYFIPNARHLSRRPKPENPSTRLSESVCSVCFRVVARAIVAHRKQGV